MLLSIIILMMQWDGRYDGMIPSPLLARELLSWKIVVEIEECANTVQVHGQMIVIIRFVKVRRK